MTTRIGRLIDHRRAIHSYVIDPDMTNAHKNVQIRFQRHAIQQLKSEISARYGEDVAERADTLTRRRVMRENVT